ncbi:MAG TPA: phosphatase PAP2 family protein [Pyrinomonadaceae bacterium]|nr:phosphatase PAP2 family protein [Pyrinomonadaceae bacterium]
MSSGEEQKVVVAAGTAAPVETVSRWRAVRRLWRAQTVYFVALGVFAVLAIFAYLDPYFAWDLKVSSAFNWTKFTPPGVFSVMEFTSIFGNGWMPYALAAATMAVFWVRGLRSEAVGLLLSTAGSGLINSALKLLIARARPSVSAFVPAYRDTVSQSFPSGHVTFYVCYFGFLFFVAYALLPLRSTVRRLALTLAALPVLLVGLSRIYLGAHWPSDTIGAYLWSGVWLAFSLAMYRRWKERRTFHGEEKVVSGNPNA